jgi:hypothetical protein
MADDVAPTWQGKLFAGLYPESVAQQNELWQVDPSDRRPDPPRHTCGGLPLGLECPACAAGLPRAE